MEGILRCWKCRRFVLNADSLSLPQGIQKSKMQDAAEESTGQINCTVWHVKLESIPEWIQKEIEKASSSNLTTSDDDEIKWEKEGYICAVCLDIFFSPYMCYPCHHIFCEPCLRSLAKDNPTSTPCPLCRTIITRVFFQTELNNTMKSLFSEEYIARRQSFQKASCAKWPLPSCRRLIKVLGGFRRRPDPVARRQFPHGAYRLDFEDDNRGWRFDMDMVTQSHRYYKIFCKCWKSRVTQLKCWRNSAEEAARQRNERLTFWMRPFISSWLDAAWPAAFTSNFDVCWLIVCAFYRMEF
ncbi:E3 ubiquitin-protein ligase RNF180 isoform X2 [Mobula hypostoma]|uniref:E3 ubiquitin-protein ligase RNF180 isoform X2 n=1 Tax=Mobula hypostoma TaxID=723540 RepID=UPI002FC2D41B